MIDRAIIKLPGMKKMLGLLAGLAVLQAIFIIGQAYTIASAITGLWEGGRLQEQVKWIIAFLIVYAGRHIVTFLRDLLLDDYAYEQACDLRNQLLQKIFRMGPQVVQQEGTGNMTTMALDGINQVENYIHLILAKIMNMMIIPWLILIVVFLLDWQSGIVLLIVFPIIIIFMIVLGYAAQSKADKQYHAFQVLSNHFIDSLRGIDTLKLFGLSKGYGKSIFHTSERFRKATMSTLKIAILSTFALDFFTTLSVAVVAVLLGLRLINGAILLFPALTVLILAPEYFLPIRDFSSDYHATLDGKNAMTAVNAVLTHPEKEVVQKDLRLWNNESQLTINQLTFHYEDQPALSSLSFSVNGYKKIGIIGMSGSGKSTLINILSGFLHPDEGDIQLDETVDSFAQHSWQKQLIYIPQNPYVFQLSLKENVAFYHPEATIQEIEQAIEVAGLSELVKELPEGMETQLGEGARTLSGGQAQRIALARAFLDHSRKILLLDEPTAHLDIETEVELKERMLPLMEERLVFFATHRLHWMKEMDYILVMEKGQLVEQGTLEELQAKNGAFVRLSQQMRGRADG
ncbi:thiol reductant ABC exporter subunit CydD [Enterococcus phoeniculicola]|jgi:ATP-binding cassette subfamily C protein CydD|uniref:Thiol reductant ABC exporter, CydD subunit n=1 Tax=Enterococcus phoeniculicola ATCC BAA-412 TaxID=1158610 RepID=R3W4G2_9ENTE|nr:thiol reductant ABC exporter subunit CydD [Enterococcus phoeniculicola]EOL42416.1 thiol reductant ABC exporter, CydD subunit [Enterococcus phoeniculicola ATCC BAA-412]EOT79305.1 thiol reductant ABC exporter, CydD subunit [Enterococcus phoeniculicola ATCC BAA-412]